MSVPAVVGSWPEPFAQASADHPRPVHVECLGVRPACEAASHRLAAAGVKAPVESGAQDGSASGPRVLVGPWKRVRTDPAVDELRAPQSTGVFATFKGPIHGGWHLIGLDQTGHPTRDLGSTAPASSRRSGGRVTQPTWIVTGSGGSAVRPGGRRPRLELAARPLRDRGDGRPRPSRCRSSRGAAGEVADRLRPAAHPDRGSGRAGRQRLPGVVRRRRVRLLEPDRPRRRRPRGRGRRALREGGAGAAPRRRAGG